MLKTIAHIVCVAFLVGCHAAPRDPTPLLLNVHAHNDYEHARPLYEALDNGFCSVEADIVLTDGELLVAHDRKHVAAGRTLTSLYLEPLRQRIASNGGRVYRNGPSVILLIDFKTDWKTTYPKLCEVLQSYADILTSWRGDQKHVGAITVVMTGGHPPPSVLLAQPIRYAAMDGKLEDVDSDVPISVMPQIAISWTSLFHWNTLGSMPANERTALHQLVERVHAHGRTLRLWGAPDNPACWTELLNAGVDFINTDNLPGLRAFLLRQATSQPSLPDTRTIPADSPRDLESK